MSLTRLVAISLLLFVSMAAGPAKASQCIYTYNVYDFFDNGQYNFTYWEITSIDCSAAHHTQTSPLDDPMMLVDVGDPVFGNQPPEVIPDNSTNEWTAYCTSDVDDRRSHANRDVALLNASRVGQGPVKGFVKVTYNDGGTEVWPIMIPAASSPIALADPVPNSLECP